MLKSDETSARPSGAAVAAELPALVLCWWRAGAQLLLGRVQSEQSLPSIMHQLSHGREGLSTLLASAG